MISATPELSLQVKTLILYATAPELVLSTEEIARKFSVKPQAVGSSLRQLTNIGLLVREVDGEKAGRSSRTASYKAGPRLLEELGEEV